MYFHGNHMGCHNGGVKSSGSMTGDFPGTNNFFPPENVLYINLAGVRSVQWTSE